MIASGCATFRADDLEWVAIRDLNVGDHIYSRAGKPVEITFAGPVVERECVRVVTAGKNVDNLICTPDHVLPVVGFHKPVDATGGQVGVRQTEVSEAGRLPHQRSHTSSRPRLLGHSPVEIPDRDLGFDPYFYGLHLSDGSKDSARIALDWRDPEFNKMVSPRRPTIRDRDGGGRSMSVSVPGLYGWLRIRGETGVRRKIVARDHVAASHRVRVATLQGLGDGDGTAHDSHTHGAATFKNTNEMIVSALHEILDLEGVTYNDTFVPGHYDGRGFKCADAVDVLYRPPYTPFRHPRKASGFRRSWLDVDRRRVDAVEPAGVFEVREIRVGGGSWLATRSLHQVADVDW